MGVILARQGKFQEAIGHFSRALQVEPDSLRTRMNMNRVREEVARRGVAIE
jgi:Flp pilus assembly protein TadD